MNGQWQSRAVVRVRILHGAAKTHFLVIIHLQTATQQFESLFGHPNKLGGTFRVRFRWIWLNGHFTSGHAGKAVVAFACDCLLVHIRIQWSVIAVRMQTVAIVQVLHSTGQNLRHLVCPCAIPLIALPAGLRANTTVYNGFTCCLIVGAHHLALHLAQIIWNAQKILQSWHAMSTSLLIGAEIDQAVIAATMACTLLFCAFATLLLRGTFAAIENGQTGGHVIVQLCAIIAICALTIAMHRLGLARIVAAINAGRHTVRASFLNDCHRLVREHLQLDKTAFAPTNFCLDGQIPFIQSGLDLCGICCGIHLLLLCIAAIAFFRIRSSVR